MTNISILVNNLSSPRAGTRYDACEELRVSEFVTDEALSALEEALKDPNADVADAARRALLTHAPTNVLPSSLVLPAHPPTHQSPSTFARPSSLLIRVTNVALAVLALAVIVALLLLTIEAMLDCFRLPWPSSFTAICN